MQTIHLRPAEPARDFAELAAMFTSLANEPTTEPGLLEDYQKHQEQIFCLSVAEDEQGRLLGFTWAYLDRVGADRASFYLLVKPEARRQGVGARLYQDLESAAASHAVQTLRVSLDDTCVACRRFAELRGYCEIRHQIAMALDLAAFDDRPYQAVIARLEGEGFQFTSMEALGNTEEAQRKLFILNDTTSATTPGTNGEHPWASFEEFQKNVCQSDWYKPAGQMVVIDTHTGAWVAMSAITRFEGADYAYNLFTGVDLPYRGRKLGQAVKVLALRYARQVLGVSTVRTHHNNMNFPMIAIDRKFGYVQTPGLYLLEKHLTV
ncbi:MAG: GNAT family N-acetyltransferase [Anaerolineales bacterium]|jgi:GNAT superfamily N-acetyltransferase|nr:GNAT family N-acetyltransferase [Anaerolineales bacterium]